MAVQIIVIDDSISLDDPLFLELGEKYGGGNIHLFSHSQEGLDYILGNLDKLMIVLLDIRFPSAEKDGYKVLKEIRSVTQLIPVIIWSVRSGLHDDFSDLLRNKVFSYVGQTEGTEKIMSVIEAANNSLSNNVDCAIEQWLKTQPNRNTPMIATKCGKVYTANQLIREIRLQTENGVELQNSINQLTVDLLFRGKKKLTLK